MRSCPRAIAGCAMVSPVPAAAFSTPSYSTARLPGRLIIAIGGEYARITRPTLGAPERREWRRGEVVTFTPRSRSRMLQSLAQIRRTEGDPDAYMVTFTYPNEFPSSVRECKRHLARWQKRLLRAYPEAWFYWKLEFQKRGATHFHLIVFDVGTMAAGWFRDNWLEIVDANDRYHDKYGCHVDKLYTWKQAGSYCAKYCAKVDTQQVIDSPGRFWGIANRKQRPVTIVQCEITDEEFVQIRRCFRRYMKQRAGYYGPGGPMSGVWTRMSDTGAKRALEWGSNARGPTPVGRMLDSPPTASFSDMRAAGNYPSSTAALRAARQTTTGRSTDTPTLGLFDSPDLERRRALRVLS